MALLTDLLSANTTNIAANATAVANAGGAWELVSSTDVTSSVSSVDFTNLSSGYIYKLIIEGAQWAVGGNVSWMIIRWMNGSTPYIDGIYRRAGYQTTSSGSGQVESGSGNNAIYLSSDVLSVESAGWHFSGDFTIYNLGETGNKEVLLTGTCSTDRGYITTNSLSSQFGNQSSSYNASNVDGIQIRGLSYNLGAGRFTLLRASTT